MNLGIKNPLPLKEERAEEQRSLFRCYTKELEEKTGGEGVVSAKLKVAAALAATGVLSEIANYPVRNTLLLSFLKSTPHVERMDQITTDHKFEEVVESAKTAAVLVLVY